jgi:hypothetical protein
MLIAGRLNLAGEFHSESNARRPAELQFCTARAGSTDYWTEAAFPVVPEGGNYANTGNATADLMEYRAAHGAALLVGKLDKQGDLAINASGMKTKDAAQPVADVNTEVQALRALRAAVALTWQGSNQQVNDAVWAIYHQVDQALGAYDSTFPGASLPDQQKAIRTFFNNRVELRDLLPALATAVGAAMPDNRSGVQLSDWMRFQRSRFMGLAAVHSGKKKGVWKVGEGHIQDLVSKKANVQMTGINLVSRQDFNDEFAAWQQG